MNETANTRPRDASDSPAAPGASDGVTPSSLSARHPWLTQLAKAALGLILLAIVFTRVDLGELTAALWQADLFFCALACGLIVLAEMFVALQLRIGLSLHGIRFSLFELWRIQFVAAFYGVVVPSQLSATAVKWYKLSRGRRYLAQTLALVLYVRIINTMSLMALGLVAAFWDSHLGDPPFRHLAWLLFAGLVVSSAPFVSKRAGRFTTRVLKRTAGRLPAPEIIKRKIKKLWDAMIAFGELQDSQVALILLFGIGFHTCGIASLYVLCHAVAVDLHLVSVAWVQLVLYMVQLFPISVAGLGVREATLTYILPHVYGQTAAAALGLSLLIFARRLFIGLVGGMAQVFEVVFPQTEPSQDHN